MTNAAVGSSTHTSVIFTAGSPNCHSFSRTLRPICHPFSRSSPYCHPERSEGSLFLCTRDSSSLALLRMTKKGAPRDDKRMVLHTTTRMVLHTTTRMMLHTTTKKRCISERQKKLVLLGMAENGVPRNDKQKVGALRRDDGADSYSTRNVRPSPSPRVTIFSPTDAPQ